MTQAGERVTVRQLPERMPPEVVRMVVHELRQVEMALGAHWDSAEAHRVAVERTAAVITVLEDYS